MEPCCPRVDLFFSLHCLLLKLVSKNLLNYIHLYNVAIVIVFFLEDPMCTTARASKMCVHLPVNHAESPVVSLSTQHMQMDQMMEGQHFQHRLKFLFSRRALLSIDSLHILDTLSSFTHVHTWCRSFLAKTIKYPIKQSLRPPSNL